MKNRNHSKIIYKPSTNEVLYCLSSMPQWSDIMLQNCDKNKAYKPFLEYLINTYPKFSEDERLIIKNLAAASGFKTNMVTKWIHAIYDDIIELNYIKPNLFFTTKGVNISLAMKSYDNFCFFNATLPMAPRKFELFEFTFIKAKMGTSTFWVDNVTHCLEEEMVPKVHLRGGFPNAYREFLVEKALFHRWISDMDLYHKYEFEIDDELRQLSLHR